MQLCSSLNNNFGMQANRLSDSCSFVESLKQHETREDNTNEAHIIMLLLLVFWLLLLLLLISPELSKWKEFEP